jgi:hypothetical protein
MDENQEAKLRLDILYYVKDIIKDRNPRGQFPESIIEWSEKIYKFVVNR